MVPVEEANWSGRQRRCDTVCVDRVAEVEERGEANGSGGHGVVDIRVPWIRCVVLRSEALCDIPSESLPGWDAQTYFDMYIGLVRNHT